MLALQSILRIFYLPFCGFQTVCTPQRYSSTRVSITRINRHQYGRMYPVHLVLVNGATVRIRYKEPRNIIQLPLDLAECSEEERARRILRRKPKARLSLHRNTDFEDSFNQDAYDFLLSGSQTKKPKSS